LAAMTEDRNLWRDAHDEDCPNKAMLDESTVGEISNLEAIKQRDEALAGAYRLRVALQECEQVLQRLGHGFLVCAIDARAVLALDIFKILRSGSASANAPIPCSIKSTGESDEENQVPGNRSVEDALPN
jgi:hypothetical protein